MKHNSASLTIGGETVTVKNEWLTWAHRSATLYQRLDDTDIHRVDDVWPQGVDGLNTNLYPTGV